MRKFREIRVLSSSRILVECCSSKACRDLVRQHDYENFFIGLIAPRSVRQDFYAIHAFNTEMALVKCSVRGNSTAGRLRYKWWNDYVASLYREGTVASEQHPVADSLRSLVKRKRMSRRWFESVIEARSRDLLPPQIHTLSDLEDVVEKSHSSVLYLLLESLEVIEDEDEKETQDVNNPVMHMASHVGCAFGIVSMLRGVLHDLAQVPHQLQREI